MRATLRILATHISLANQLCLLLSPKPPHTRTHPLRLPSFHPVPFSQSSSTFAFVAICFVFSLLLAQAVMFGAGHLHVLRDLGQIMGDHVLSPEELSQMSAAFLKKASERRTVTLAEFTEVLENLGLSGHLPVQRLFSAFDIDGSGTVDYREFLTGIASLRKEDEQALRMCFRVFDADGDGSVSREELIMLLAATGFDINEGRSASSSSSSSASSGPAAAGASAGGAAAHGGEEAAAIEAAAREADEAGTGGMDAPEPKYYERLSTIFEKIDANSDGKCESTREYSKKMILSLCWCQGFCLFVRLFSLHTRITLLSFISPLAYLSQ